MNIFNTRSYDSYTQFTICSLSVCMVAVPAYLLEGFIGYRVVALLLLMTVSILAMLFEIAPVLLAAFLSAVGWNFFFIPPVFTFHIINTEDNLLFLLYFVVALVNTVLSFKIRKEEKKVRDKAGKEQQLEFYTVLLNSLSHELKTPIATIVGASDTLREPELNLTKKQTITLLQEINQAGERLNRQVENLLNMSRIQSGMLTIKRDWCDSNELIASVLKEFDSNDSHNLFFEPDDSLPFIKIDRGLMEQVIHNLVHNGILYTPQNSTVRIISVCKENSWKLRISDNGKGIDAIYFEQLFEQFYRLPNSKAGGTGLGLSIVKGFVTMHGGTIDVRMNTENHLEFTIHIPVEMTYMNQISHE